MHVVPNVMITAIVSISNVVRDVTHRDVANRCNVPFRVDVWHSVTMSWAASLVGDCVPDGHVPDRSPRFLDVLRGRFVGAHQIWHLIISSVACQEPNLLDYVHLVRQVYAPVNRGLGILGVQVGVMSQYGACLRYDAGVLDIQCRYDGPSYEYFCGQSSLNGCCRRPTNVHSPRNIQIGHTGRHHAP